MKRARNWLLALLMLPFLGGCYYHSHSDYYEPNTLVIENHPNSWHDILYAYAEPVYSGTWGEDLLGTAILHPGDQLVVDIYECNQYYDVMVEYDNGLTVVKQDLWLPCNTTTVLPFYDY